MKEKPKPSYAPVYAAALYPELAAIFKAYGYALAVHGSLQRDLDLVAIPWIARPAPIATILGIITTKFAIRLIGNPDHSKPHGRVAYMISVGHGECAIDLSVMPLIDEDTHE